jgi:hypothetical protein
MVEQSQAALTFFVDKSINCRMWEPGPETINRSYGDLCPILAHPPEAEDC